MSPRGKRPSDRSAAEQRDEGAAVHSITSSARTRREVGIVRPSALAVLRLMINPILDSCYSPQISSPCAVKGEPIARTS